MMGGARKSAAVSAAPIAGNRKAIAGTIAEAAAIARRAAEDREGGSDGDSSSARSPNEHEGRPAAVVVTGSVEAPSPSVEADPAVDPMLLRRSRAGAGQLKDAAQGPDRTAVHLILAGRAYAYGKSIVHGDGSKAPGDAIAIES